ncbi:symporter small accessory protein [Candidatus Methanomassiliicoccus intestinalis]
MLGIEDPWILTAYALLFLSAALCVIYPILRRKDKEDEE